MTERTETPETAEEKPGETAEEGFCCPRCGWPRPLSDAKLAAFSALFHAEYQQRPEEVMRAVMRAAAL